MNATVYIANLLPIDAARIAQSMDLNGTTHDALGFGAGGVEPTTVVEFGDIHQDRLASFLQEIFTECPEEDALYVVTHDAGAKGIYREDIPCTV